MLNLGRLKNLADAIGLEPRYISEVLDDFNENPTSLVTEMRLWRADFTKKPRDVIAVRGRWRKIQQRIYRKLLLPRFRPLRVSHGGVTKRSPATNARAHLGNTFAFVTDISGFFPAISCYRVNDLFLRNACTYEIARILTRLCTYDYHLALGLVTSPIIANEVFRPIDKRISHACRKIGLVYTRFIDDITISGNFDLAHSGIEAVVRNIVERHGYSLAKNKTACGRLDRDITITGVRLKNHHLDPSRHFVDELDRLIKNHESLAADGAFDGDLMTENELFGKAHYACFINPGRRRSILGRLKSINWDDVRANAVRRQLLIYRDRLTMRDEPKPDCSEPLYWRNEIKHDPANHEPSFIDPRIAPFDDSPAFAT